MKIRWACGCGQWLESHDKRKRPRRYKIKAETPLLWRKDELGFLMPTLDKQSDEEIALKLGRTTRSVQSKRIHMGMIREQKVNVTYGGCE